MSCCAMASSISSSHLHRDRRHPRRRLAYVAAVAIMRCRPIHDAGPAHPPGSYADVSSVLPRPPMSLLPPSGALQRALLAAFAAAASLSARHFCLQSLGAAIAVLSLSLGQLQPAVSGRHPLGSSPPPFSAELLAAAARFVPGARCLCLIVVGALAPLCFLFSVFQNARPPATPRWLGPPLTQRSKNVGLGPTAGEPVFVARRL